jgi:hypothetical protein
VLVPLLAAPGFFTRLPLLVPALALVVPWAALNCCCCTCCCCG